MKKGGRAGSQVQPEWPTPRDLVRGLTFEPISQVVLDLGAVGNNALEIRRLVGSAIYIVASLKSNAHGFGLIEVASTVLNSGADAVAVVNLDDAVKLRQSGIRSPIILYAGTVADESSVRVVDQLDLIPTLLDLQSARIFSTCSARALKYCVKVDVGLQRVGLDPEDVLPFVRKLDQLPRLILHGVYTHMHAVDGADANRYLEWQYERFSRVLSELSQAGIQVPITLAASSRVLMMSTTMTLNAIDPGRLFYGLLAPTPVLADLRFEPAFRSLKSRLVQVKKVSRSDFTDLAPFPVRPRMRIGIFPLGRSDGMLSLSTDHVLVGGKRAPILAKPSLEQTRIDVTDIPDVSVGDEVVIIGRQGSLEIRPDQVAAHLGMDPGELAIGIRGSIHRQYLRPT